MQSTNQISETIHQIFKIINVVYDSTVISFDDQQLFEAKLKDVLEQVSKIDLSNVSQEVWAESSDFLKYDSIVDIMNDRFDPLLTWKPNVYDIVILKDSLKKDLKNYFEKMNHLGVIIIPKYNEIISKLYIQIGLRFLKVKLDLDKIMVDLQNKSMIADQKELEKKSTAAGYNIKMAPNKVLDFTRLIYKLYFEDYFCPLDNKNGITEIDVLLAFEKFFDVDIVDAEWFTPDLMFDDEAVCENVSSKKVLNIKNDSIISNDLFPSFLLFNQKDRLALKLKEVFNTETGKSIRLLLLAMEEHNPQLITVGNRKLKQTYNAVKSFFNRDIGTYQSVASFKYDEIKDKPDFESIQRKLNYCISLCNE